MKSQNLTITTHFIMQVRLFRAMKPQKFNVQCPLATTS